MNKKLQFIQNLVSSKFSVAICIVLFILPTLYVYYNYDVTKYSNSLEYYPLTNMNMAFIINLFIYIIPIVSTLSISQYAKDQERLSPFLYTRESKKKEIISTAFTAFWWGFLIVLITLVTMYLISMVSVNQNATYFPSEVRNISFEGQVYTKFPLYNLYYNKPVWFHSFYILLISCYSGLLSLLCYGLNLVLKKGYSITLYMFGGSLAFILLCGLFNNGLVVWYPQNLMMADPLIASNPGVFTNILGKQVLMITLLLVSVSLIYYKVKGKDV